jgi:hypothetical protein
MWQEHSRSNYNAKLILVTYFFLAPLQIALLLSDTATICITLFFSAAICAYNNACEDSDLMIVEMYNLTLVTRVLHIVDASGV